MPKKINQEGGVVPILILLAAIGVVAFILITGTFDFRDTFFNKLFPKPTSDAQGRMSSPSTPDEILIKFKPGASKKAQDANLKKFGLTVKSTVPKIDVIVAKVPEKAKEKVLKALSNNPNIDYIELNNIRQVEATPNDLYYSARQWNLARIGAANAWDSTQGNVSMSVGVVDTGVFAEHEDLVGKINPGVSFVDYTTSTNDDHGHGTIVTGIIAAATNNSKGVAGLGWNTHVTPLKACNQNGECLDNDVAEAIIYATDNNIKVINLSLGGYGLNQTIQNAIDYAYARGVVVVAASGNVGNGVVFYPAAGQNVLGIGSTDGNDKKANFSNYGTGLDVVAPGLGIYSTNRYGTYSSHAGTSYSAPEVSALAALMLAIKPELTVKQIIDSIASTAEKIDTVSGNIYDSNQNNSKGYLCNGWNEYYGCGQINVLNAIQKASGITVTSDTTRPTVSIISPTNGATVSSEIAINVSATDNVGVTHVTLIFDNESFSVSDFSAPYSFLWSTIPFGNGPHTITVKAFDLAGNVGTATITVTVDNQGYVPDTTHPTVSITSPTNNDTVSGNVTISANASDNIAVSSVSFTINGQFVDTDTTAPYSMNWDSTAWPNGNLIISASSWDNSYNVSTASQITVNVANSSYSEASYYTQSTYAQPTPTPVADISTVVISNVSVSTTANSATITWTTNVPSTSKVQYGSSGSLNLNLENSNLVTNHSAIINGLNASTRYYYQVSSRSSGGLESSSGTLQLRTKNK
jgi:thermitase